MPCVLHESCTTLVYLHRGLQTAPKLPSMHYPPFDRCDYPFFQPEFSTTMAALGLAASIIVAVAVDRILYGRPSTQSPPTDTNTSLTLSETNVEWVLIHCEYLEQELVQKDRDYKGLKLATAASQAKYLHLERHFLSNEAQYEHRIAELESNNAQLRDLVEAQQKEHRLKPFVFFVDRLLVANKMWQQQRELVKTKSLLAQKEREIRSRAFANLWDRLLAANLVWKQQRRMREMREEAEKMKKGRVRAVTRSAKQMVLDTRKDGLVEELVKGLIEDVQRAKERENQLKESHEREIQDMREEWMEEKLKLLSEIKGLRLGREARLIEQEISNEQEDRLIASLAESRNEIQRLSGTTCTSLGS